MVGSPPAAMESISFVSRVTSFRRHIRGSPNPPTMKKNNVPKKSIELETETVRVLAQVELSMVTGGLFRLRGGSGGTSCTDCSC